MKTVRTSLLFMLAVATLTAGCQTATNPGAGEAGTAGAEAATPQPTSVTATPAATSQAGTKSKAGEETGAMSMPITVLQQRLTELGYKPGPVDGKAGPKTTNALKKFQRDHKLPVTGTLDAKTIVELNRP